MVLAALIRSKGGRGRILGHPALGSSAALLWGQHQHAQGLKAGSAYRRGVMQHVWLAEIHLKKALVVHDESQQAVPC